MSLFAVGCVSVVTCLYVVVCGLSFDVWCLLFVALPVVRCLCLLFCCVWVLAVCCLFAVCCLCVVCLMCACCLIVV